MRGYRWAAIGAGLTMMVVMATPGSGERSDPGPAAEVISYELTFATYLGGAGGELIRDLTVDSDGNLYVAGVAGGPDFPRSPGHLPGQSQGGGAMVAKFSPDGRLVWSRVCGGLGESSYFYSVEVDQEGCVFVAGRMGPGFPTTPGAPQRTTRHPCGFIGKLTPDASAWMWATYVGTGYAVRDMTMDDRGDLYAILDYFAESPETLPAEWFAKAYQKAPRGGSMNHFGKSDAGVIKIASDGQVAWATWIGGSNGNDWVASVGVGTDHCPVVMLNTTSPDMPTTPQAFCPTSPDPRRQAAGQAVPWVGKLSADGSRLLFGTYLGVSRGTPFARTHNVAVDPQGNVFVAFQTQDDLPATAGAFQMRPGGQGEVGVEKLSPSGALLACTYVGGSGEDSSNGPDQIALDGQGNVVLATCSNSTDYPVTAGALQPRNAGAGGQYPFDAVVSILSNDLSTLLYSTYIGGSGDEMARACCFAAEGTLCLGGVTTSRDFPVRNAWQEKYGGDPGYGSIPNGGKFPVGWGNGDCWLAKLRPVG